MKEPEEKVRQAAQRCGAGNGAETLRAWARKPESRAQMQRVLDELALSWEERGRTPVSDTFPELADTAEAFKNGMMLLRPKSSGDWGAVLSTSPAFWNRVVSSTSAP